MPREDELAQSARLGRYGLVRRIGKGGMGEVFLGKVSGAHGFEKLVAIKRILPQFSANPHVINMLVDEARISVLLNHPNVVQVLELGEDNGDYFIVMEFVDGHALSRLLRKLKKANQRLDVLDACYIAIQLLEGLHAAHVQKDHRGKPAGIIHRDVSPQNVLLSMEGVVKVIDFGIARARERLEVTQGVSVKGKLRYMAPEQLSPKVLKGKPLDHRADIFAAGVVLFEMVAMRQRFPGNGEVEIMDAILHDQTPDLVREGICDREMQDILEGALSRERTTRFADAQAFAARLRGYLYKRDPGYTSERIAKRMRWAFGRDGRSDGDAGLEDEREAEGPRLGRERGRNSDPRSPADDVRVDVDATRTVFRPVGVDVTGTNSKGRRNKGARALAGAGGGPARAPRSRARRAAGLLIGLLVGIGALGAGVIAFRVRIEERLHVDLTRVLGPRLGAVDAGPAAVLVDAGAAAAPLPVTDAGQPAAAPALPGPSTPVAPPPVAPALPAPPAPPVTVGPVAVGPVAVGPLVEIPVRAEPATTKISLPFQPDRRFVSPAQIPAPAGVEVEILFEADGFAAERRKVTPQKGMAPVVVALRAEPVDLILRVNPRDAVAIVDGARIGTGTKLVPGRTYDVRIEHPLYGPRAMQVTPIPGVPVVLEVNLEDRNNGIDKGGRVHRGTLLITSEPPGAEVFIDGRKLKDVTPTQQGVLAGSHRVSVRTANGEATRPVDVPDGQSVTAAFDLRGGGAIQP